MATESFAHTDTVLARGLSVRVRFFAGAADAAGAEELSVPLPRTAMPLGLFVDELPGLVPASAADEGAPSLERVCARSSFLVNGTRTGRESGVINDGDVLDVLPPFAGG
ncbi:MoaD/ThiS family protein [Nesterenkonia sp. NBAIMH1]|uniref:MoaD/ThiS family protein n=1 Tax=Nesterenkonia sp. NBAIMH1 TaxID=2600320 RepID=UPI001AF018E1|nr:MoaD/ThiS family protein [Nesterenkonia sp. NBAIMH1]